jgi:hypothetical protein
MKVAQDLEQPEINREADSNHQNKNNDVTLPYSHKALLVHRRER